MLTTINSRISEEKESRLSTKVKKEDYSGARLKLMMLRENNKMKRAMTKIPEFSSSTISHNQQNNQEYAYTKPQTLHRYDKFKTEENNPGRKSQSEGKTLYNNYGRSLTLKKGIKDSNIGIK